MLRFAWRSAASRVLLALAPCCLALPSLAQQTLGSLNGTVLDPSGASVAGATVTVTDAAINVTRATTTQKNGFFQIFNLPVGTYSVSTGNAGFETTTQSGIEVLEAQAKTVNLTLKVGNTSQTVEVTANPLLNATDITNGYTLDATQIAATPLATGSFTQLAVLSPGTSAELLANLDSNAGLGNQPIWANGQRDTSNTFQVDGVDVTNIFNGKSSSDANSQRYNFGVGEIDSVGGEYGTGTSVYESNGNSLPSPPPEFLQELRVNTSMYDAQQGATAGAQIDANTAVGTNSWHGQVYGTFANNSLNADPLFFKQEAQLSDQGIGAFPDAYANPSLHRWTTGATFGGPIKKDKLFFFLAYQHGYESDQATGLSQVTVPPGLTDNRTTTGLENALTSWNNGTPISITISPIAAALMNAKLPNGQYMIPSAQNSSPYAYGVTNATLNGTSLFTTDQATASIDWNATSNDRLSFKYFYQNDPVNRPYGLSAIGGFPLTLNNGAQLGAIDNTISIGPRLNWEQRLGYVRMSSYSFDHQTVQPDASLGPTFGIGTGSPLLKQGIMPGLDLLQFANNGGTSTPSLSVGPNGTESTTINTGYYQNRLNPSSNLIFQLGKHTLMAGGGYSYTQLNIENNRGGIANVSAYNFEDFLKGEAYKSNVIDSIDPVSGRNNSDRYYRSNEATAYLQDKWQLTPNLSITAGVRYDYHGGMTEKYGNFFTFNPTLYSVQGTSTTGFTVNNAGFVVAPNNRNLAGTPKSNIAGSDSTLDGRQWGISPRLGFAWSPQRNHGTVVFRGGAGIYYDRGELFSYLSQPYGASGGGGVFGVTQSEPLVTYINGTGKTLANPIGTPSYLPPSSSPAYFNNVLQAQLNTMTGSDPPDGPNCGALDNQVNYLDCTATIDFGSYDPHNVLPYTINFTFGMEWQPANDISVSIGYVGNRGRHSVIPIPFNEPGIATPQHPIWGETASYGYQVLNQNNTVTDQYGGDDYLAIAGEPWNTYSGGNIDFRTPYVGYNFNSSLFKTVGNSAYDALETHIEKRLSHNFQAGASYTWSHALDEQSDIGIFFTGDNPNNLRDSYASADFDRTNVFSVNFEARCSELSQSSIPSLSYVTNGWNLTGVGIAQSGEPYSLYEFYGAVGQHFRRQLPQSDEPGPAHQGSWQSQSRVHRQQGYLPRLRRQLHSHHRSQRRSPSTTFSPARTAFLSRPAPIPRTSTRPTSLPPTSATSSAQPFQKRLDLSVRKAFQITERFTLRICVQRLQRDQHQQS